MSRPPLEVADLIRAAGTAFLERNRQWIRWKHVKVLLAIARCRTAALGGHFDECTGCAHRAPISYNSCRDRHCPKCQIAARERWIAARRPFGSPVDVELGRACQSRTPQGAPISPLLSNLYMRRFVLGWKKLGHEKRLAAYIVNYADDLVICCRGRAEEALALMWNIMTKLKLTMKE